MQRHPFESEGAVFHFKLETFLLQSPQAMHDPVVFLNQKGKEVRICLPLTLG